MPGLHAHTRLFEGFEDTDKRASYALQPKTVAEEMVKAVLAGRSRHLMLPGAGWYTSQKRRGWLIWMQYGLRKRPLRLMKEWKRRQVEQPNEGGVGRVRDVGWLRGGGCGVGFIGAFMYSSAVPAYLICRAFLRFLWRSGLCVLGFGGWECLISGTKLQALVVERVRDCDRRQNIIMRH